ncbi:uncharacterized protein LOC112844088 isoform X2 [Oreochromis niloticus]|uniref:uncharacterized protein LOC112844088 isoform X2 n=1 Tax=Oreochromis niloticus TaxID=8128 RepID=UPI000DF2CE03|nr:uncharacterized protein LOC112844088 isoform X2 [Oreochromis niloticus]CAI5660585.1 unnamed protein product [Mustela putorius furo]
MAALISLSLWCIWMSVSILRSAASNDPNPITAKPGENVTLKCQAPNNNILVVEWMKADLKEEYVLLYRDGHLYPDDQLLSFKNRVDLQDRQMKDGDVSLILKNVTINDAGTYECRVVMKGANRRTRANLDGDPSCSISLSVVDPSGQPGGGREDGGKEDGGKEDGGKEDGGKEAGFYALVTGLPVTAVLLFFAITGGIFIYRRKEKHPNKLKESNSSSSSSLDSLVTS